MKLDAHDARVFDLVGMRVTISRLHVAVSKLHIEMLMIRIFSTHNALPAHSAVLVRRIEKANSTTANNKSDIEFQRASCVSSCPYYGYGVTTVHRISTKRRKKTYSRDSQTFLFSDGNS